ncbi:MAG TPA: patatin-like phospholipase family protein, partial [Solirubrobacter sp.]|nr:patatin-like phospholipase family protein [Solirubrobacter sp.]
MRITDLPDALVLGVGGTLGEAWLRGVLGGLEAGAGLDFRRCEYFLGTSAGSIVAATLAAGRRPEAGDRAAREWGEAAPEGEAREVEPGEAAPERDARRGEPGKAAPERDARAARAPGEARRKPDEPTRAPVLGAVARAGRAAATPFA